MWLKHIAGIECKDFILGFRQSTFLCTTLKCTEKFRIPFIKSGIPASNLGSLEARNPAKFAACICITNKQNKWKHVWILLRSLYILQRHIHRKAVPVVKKAT